MRRANRFDNWKKSTATHFKNVKQRLKKVCIKIITLENRRKIVLFVCVAALAVDPLFFFIPVIDSRRSCLTLDKKLVAAVCVLRTFIDTLYVIHIILCYIIEVIAPRPQVSIKGELTVHSEAVRKKRTYFYFIVDIVSVLPVLQVVVLTLIPRKQYSYSLVTNQILKWVMICHNLPRVIRIYPLFKEVTRASGTITETKWIGAALNLCLYMLQSHVFGAFWYLGAIEKKDKCWRQACAQTPGCIVTNLYCARSGGDNSGFLSTSCPLIDLGEIKNSTVFNFGMYIDALKSGLLESMDFPRKFFYCFWWGLRNLSALGQNLETSNSIGEIFFAIIICVSGLILFAVLIGNVQKYLQSTTVRVDEMEEEKRDTENWMSNRMLPENLKKRIRRYKDYKWRETRGTEEGTHLRNLPKDLRLEIKRYLYLDFLKKVPQFQALDARLLDELCGRLKTVLYTEKSYIVREGDPVEDIFFVIRGNMSSSTTYGGTTKSLYADRLVTGDFCGGDLISWAFHPHSSELPTSRRTVLALTEVEGFVLSADDLKFVATQYCRFKMLRCQSFECKTGAALIIQATWRRHCRRKLLKALGENDDSRSNKFSMGAMIYVSSFASTALRNLRANAATHDSDFPEMLSLLPQKPASSAELPIDET